MISVEVFLRRGSKLIFNNARSEHNVSNFPLWRITMELRFKNRRYASERKNVMIYLCQWAIGGLYYREEQCFPPKIGYCSLTKRLLLQHC